MTKAGSRLLLLAIGFASIGGTSIRGEIVADTLKTAVAERVTASIHIDGFLSEDEWKSARPITGFRQTEPDEGKPVTESTLVKILYDDEAVYVGFWCYDREPEKITRQLTRRDRWTGSDKVAVRFDSHHDHQTAYYFEINAAGVLRDILFYNNNWDDDSWDAVWEGETKITKWGWCAEYRIPYSALRFSDAEEYVWGVDFSRYIPRRNEFARWQFVPSNETSGVSRYGHLVGIKGITPPGRMETLPYVVSYEVTEPKSLGNADGREFISDIGVDFKYGLSSSITLDATINPDFGQVESDRSLINLSTYETYFEEKRPFFLEGFEIFDTPFFTQFYSRRIGHSPSGGVADAEYYIDYPRNTTILSALKLSGKTKSGISFGILNATTQEEKTEYKIEGDTKTYEAIVEPLANYSVVRVKKDIAGSSYLGGTFTSANQREYADAFTASTDWKLYFSDQMFHWSGMVIGTNNGPSTGDMALAMALNKHSGRVIQGNIFLDYYGREVDWNKLGYLGRNSCKGISSWIQFRSNKEFSVFKYLRLNFNGWYNQNLDGYRLGNGGNFNGSIGFTNNWWIWAGFCIDGSRFDDRETRDNGLWFVERNHAKWIGGNTNSAKKIQCELNYHYDNERDGFFHQYSFWTNFRPLTNFEFSIGTSYRINRDVDYWVGTGEDNLPVFGKLDNNDMDINFRGIYTFVKNLTVQWYTQFYFSAGEYDKFRKLTAPDKYDVVDINNYDIDFSRDDFNYKSLNLNLIFRWEYLPGSALFVVWTHARDRYNTDYGDFQFSRDFKDLFRTPQTNTFLVKADYWWNL